MPLSRKWIELAAITGLAAAAACGGPTHLTRTHGKSYHEFRAVQTLNPKAGTKQPQPGLDPQEAAIVAENYRKSLAPSGGEAAAEPQPVLVVAPKQ